MTPAWDAYFAGIQDASCLHEAQAAMYTSALAAAVGIASHHRVLDFGAGFGLVTALVAGLAGEVWWWEPSAHMRAFAARRLRGEPGVRFCDLTGLPFGDPAGEGTHGDAEGSRRRSVRDDTVPPRSVDRILVNSVVQYMPAEELRAWLPYWMRMLTSEGRLVLSDLIAPDHGAVADAMDLLRLGLRYRSPLAATSEAIGGVVRYRRARRAVPLTRVAVDDLTRRALDAGLLVEVLPHNLTHFRRRWSAVLRVEPEHAESDTAAMLDRCARGSSPWPAASSHTG